MEDTAPRRNMAFRRKSNSPPPSPEESRRQSDVVRSAWRHFGESGPVIAFLNTCHPALEAQPLHLAIASDEGLGRVEALLNQMSLKLNRIGKP
jgi:uncharacterized protein (DUF2384 family)